MSRNRQRNGADLWPGLPSFRSLLQTVQSLLARTWRQIASVTVGLQNRLELDLARSLTLVFSILLLVVLASSWLTYGNLSSIASREQGVTQTQAALTRLALVLKTVDDAETGQRGYILTGQSSYLQPYTLARARLPGELVQLQALLVAEPDEQQYLLTLKHLITTKLGELQQTITLQQQGQASAALSLVLSGQGEQEMDSIRSLVATMQNTEASVLVQRTAAAQEAARTAIVELLVAVLAIIGLLIGIFLVLRRYLRERERHLTEEQQARQQAEQAVMLRDEFFSIASHELKTPVTALLATTQILERRLSREGVLNERNQKAFATVDQQILRLRMLLDAMLDATRIEHGQLMLAYEPIDLGALVEEVVENIQQTTAGHLLTFMASSPDLILEGDPLRLEQVLRNLLQNAIKYSPDDTIIHLYLGKEENYSNDVSAEARSSDTHDTLAPSQTLAILTVQDQGMGISEDAQAHLFERFYRAPNARTGHASGLGIGLYVVKEIVKLHGGEITVESKEGEGSTFTVRLPIERSRVKDLLVPVALTPQLAHKNVK